MEKVVVGPNLSVELSVLLFGRPSLVTDGCNESAIPAELTVTYSGKVVTFEVYGSEKIFIPSNFQ